MHSNNTSHRIVVRKSKCQREGKVEWKWDESSKSWGRRWTEKSLSWERKIVQQQTTEKKTFQTHERKQHKIDFIKSANNFSFNPFRSIIFFSFFLSSCSSILRFWLLPFFCLFLVDRQWRGKIRNWNYQQQLELDSAHTENEWMSCGIKSRRKSKKIIAKSTAR